MDVVSPVGEVGSVGGLSGDRRVGAISELFLAHHRRLVGLASLLVDDRESAEDVVQEAFAGRYRRWRLLRDPNAAVAYLNRAVVNGGRDQLRHGRRATHSLRAMTPQPEAPDSAEHDVVEHDQADRLWRAVTICRCVSARCWSCATTSA